MIEIWSTHHIPGVTGKVAIVTGANSGIGFMEMCGYPRKIATSEAAKDIRLARRLWDVYEELTGNTYMWPIMA